MKTPREELPILMSAPMVCAINADRKGQTRRIMKPQPHPAFLARGVFSVVAQWPQQDGFRWFMRDGCSELVKSPFRPGLRLWVKEALKTTRRHGPVLYAADGKTALCCGMTDNPWPWKRKTQPAMYCPRRFSRLTLEITQVRVQPLQAITEQDALAEGFTAWTHRTEGQITARRGFMELWEKINGETFPWASNPWVYVVAFKKVKQ